MRTATITINLSAFNHNLNQVRRLAPTAKILAMVKADAYGHGLNTCLYALTHSHALTKEDNDNNHNTHKGADAIGVATFEEAKQARLLGWAKPIVIIEGAFSVEEWQRCQDLELTCVIHHQSQMQWALEHLAKDSSANQTVWLKVNTGMNRLGFDPSDILPIAKQLHSAGYHIVLTSHFANADVKSHPLNEQQISIFDSLLTQLHHQVSTDIKGSLCNSAGLINFPNHHYDWVRPGIMLYGSSPIADRDAEALNLRPVMCFAAKLMAIQGLKKGASVGYGSTYIAEYDMTKGIVSIGYGDGYPRVINVDNHKAWVSLHSSDGNIYACDIIGRISMDMLAIDITHVPTASLNDTVVLWGDNQQGCPHVDDIAASSGTISYELLCRLAQRPTRHIVS